MDNRSAQLSTSGLERRRLQADVRRQQILETAFAMVAETGFENLRTRDVADRVGINSATLHHYFPTKETLIEGIASYLEHLYRDMSSPDTCEPDLAPALRALRKEFADAKFYRAERPDMLAVSAEFMVRSTRDPTAARAIATLNQHWRRQLEEIIRQGQIADLFCRQIDPLAASMVAVGALWSATGLLRASDEEFERMCAALEAWLTGAAKKEVTGE